MNESYEILKALVKTNGLKSVCEALRMCFADYSQGHKFRKNFCSLTNGMLLAIETELAAFAEKYGYTPGKE